MAMSRRNYAVYDIKTKFRMTEYKSYNLAVLDYNAIIRNNPDLKKKVGIRQKEFEKS